MKTVEVDFNMLTDQGLVVASQQFATEELRVGDYITAWDFSTPTWLSVGMLSESMVASLT